MKNNTTADVVRRYVLHNPIMVDYLFRGLINTASLARELLPHIKKENKSATVESISIALLRLRPEPSLVSDQLKEILHNVQITMRTDVSLFCLEKGGGADVNKFGSDDIFCINQGANEVTIIVDKKNKHLVRGKPLMHKDGLALISLKDSLIHTPTNYRITPGFVHLFLANISKAGINIEDIISTYSQVSFVIEEKYLAQVFQICQDVKELKLI